MCPFSSFPSFNVLGFLAPWFLGVAAACKQINVGSPANRASQPSTQENQCDIVTSPENQASSEPLLEEECCPSQICTCKGLQRRNGDVTNEGKIEVMHMSLLEDSNSIPLAKEKQGPEAEHNMVVEQKLGAIQVFDSCDKDDEGGAIQLLDLSYDEKIARMNSRQLERAQTEAAEWYCMGPEGDTRGPYKMSFLKCWNEICTHPHRFKAWKIGQGPKRGVPLPDACRSV